MPELDLYRTLIEEVAATKDGELQTVLAKVLAVVSGYSPDRAVALSALLSGAKTGGDQRKVARGFLDGLIVHRLNADAPAASVSLPLDLMLPTGQAPYRPVRT